MTATVFDPSRGDFAVQVPVVYGTDNPAQVFESVAALIHTFQDTDRDFAQSIDAGLFPYLQLRDIEVGSLRAWFVSVLRDRNVSTLLRHPPSEISVQFFAFFFRLGRIDPHGLG